MQQESEDLKALFHQEFTKMVAVISKLFGLAHIETAEDIVSDTFLKATETWRIKGIPESPRAWLYAVAKQKTLYYFRRNKIYNSKVIPEVTATGDAHEIPALDFSRQNIKDSQLQMLFAICDPAIASEAQIGLALRILCGFGIDEIAEAFLSQKDTINKRLYRAREKLRTEGINMELPAENEIISRLDNVLHIIYLLFSEGYYSKTQNQILRRDLCFEAMRLGTMLTDYEKTNQPKTNALMALMCFHTSRFNARQTSRDHFILYDQQNKSLWDAALINQGMYFLDQSAEGSELSSYHLEARIAFCHCIKEDTPEKWEEILHLYDRLLLVNYSPMVALNRIFALYKLKGAKLALVEAEDLKMENNHFYFILLGELWKHIDAGKAETNFQKAYALARTETEKQDIAGKMKKLNTAAT